MSEATAVLAKTEDELRRLAAAAATAGDYDSVVSLADLARAVKGLSSAQPPLAPAEGKTPHANKPKSSKKYPQFFRHNDFLLKVAWSKANRAEYEHKSPKSVVLGLVKAVAQAGQKSRLIAMEKVLPLKDGANGEVPSYQSYLCLAWLRTLGVIKRHGRQGYSIQNPAMIEQKVAESWELLTERV